jgi:adenylate kinase
MSKKTELGVKAASFVENGKLAPDNLVVEIVMRFLDEHPNEKGFIFDGFPRTISQAEILRTELFERGQTIKLMLNLQVPKAELIERMRKRGKKSGRRDDQNEDILQNRLDVYENSTKPVIEFYSKHHKHYEIDGVGDINEISCRISSVIEQFI